MLWYDVTLCIHHPTYIPIYQRFFQRFSHICVFSWYQSYRACRCWRLLWSFIKDNTAGHHSDSCIDESLAFTEVDKNSCIDVFLSDVLIIRAQVGFFPGVNNNTLIQTLTDGSREMTASLTYRQVADTNNVEYLDADHLLSPQSLSYVTKCVISKSVFMGFNSNWSLSESECEIEAHSLLNRIHLSLELSTYFEVILRLLFIKFFFLDFLMCMCVSASPIPELICSSSYQSHAPKWSNYSLSDTLPAPNGTSRFHFVIVIHYHPG